jgi:predicted nucleic acid-binding protein
MAMLIEPRDELFLDTTFAIAITNAKDQYHDRGRHLAQEIRGQNASLTTTRAVLLEIGNALSPQRNPSDAVRFLQSLERDPRIILFSLSDGLYQEALALYAARPDKEWGLVDCVSFVVMAERGITKALTADEHFEQAGFQALLREMQ